MQCISRLTSAFIWWFPREEMRRSPISDLCLSIQFIPQEFSNLQVSREEFLCMKAIILLNTGKRAEDLC